MSRSFTIKLAYSTQLPSTLVNFRLVPGNVVMVATDMYGESPHYWVRRARVVVGEWIYGVTRERIYFNNLVFIYVVVLYMY